MIERWIKKEILSRMAHTPVVNLLGARQVGKTTVASELAQKRGWLYLDLENLTDRAKLEDAQGFLYSHRRNTVVIDEIQRLPELFEALRVLVDRYRREGLRTERFLILGSASMSLVRQSSQSLAGRIGYVRMSGLNALEGKGHERELWLRGGFPDSFLEEDPEKRSKWRHDLVDTYLQRDIPEMGLRVPSEKLRRVFTMLAHLHGQTSDSSTLARNLEVDSKTISRWVDILAGLFLVRRLQPWFANVKKRLVKSPRLYVRDSGILHELLGIRSRHELLAHPVMGKSWEGFVIENVCSILPSYAEPYFYRTSAGAEIDLVVSFSSGERWAIEIKYGSAPKLDRHFSRTCEDVGATHKYVVYSGNDAFGIGDGVTMISLPKLMERLEERSAKKG